jgi:hypothetical protein
MRRSNHLQTKFRRKSALALMVTIGVTFSFAHSAHADAIDGDWCHSSGKRMSIRGPAIVTPGGQETSGNYTRHFFSYVIPAGEAGAGATVEIQLLNEYLAHARQGDDPTVQEWRRCQPGVS